MSFEKTYIDGPAREKIHQIEKHVIIERPDEPRFKSDFSAEFVYKPPIIEEMTEDLKEKYEFAKKLTEDTKIINLRDKKNEKSSSKSSKSKPKKNNPKPNKAAMEKI